MGTATRFLIGISTAATTLVLFTSIAAAASDVRVTFLDCESHPRRITIENLGDAAQSLQGWQLQSDPVAGQTFDLGQVKGGALTPTQKIYVFQGHLSPPTNPAYGFYRWGQDDTFYLRAGDSTSFVRIVDAQGNIVSQRNCEGAPPSPAPPPADTPPPPPAADPPVVEAVAAAPDQPPASQRPAFAAPAAPTSAGGTLPVAGGPPLAGNAIPASLSLLLGTALTAGGALLLALGLRQRDPHR